MQETANKQKRITLKTVHQMLDGMSVELAEKVHLLFMANYIDYSDYDFRDENQVEGYCWCYRDLFELKTKESQEIVNSQLIEFLDEWRQDAPSRYRKAKDDICYWITDEWYSFESPMQKEIESAHQTALKKKDDMAIALALSPFARKTEELVNSGAYEAAAGSCYAIFRCLAEICQEHGDWFLRPDSSWTSQAAEPSGKRHPCGDAERSGFAGYGDTYTKLAIFTEAVVELYCHLRQKPDRSKRMADEMDINLEVFNLETDFFGDLHCSSRLTDMLCDAQAQYGDYSEFEKCPMWGMWVKEGVR